MKEEGVLYQEILIWRSERSECSHSQVIKIDICLVRANHTEHVRKRSSPW